MRYWYLVVGRLDSLSTLGLGIAYRGRQQVKRLISYVDECLGSRTGRVDACKSPPLHTQLVLSSLITNPIAIMHAHRDAPPDKTITCNSTHTHTHMPNQQGNYRASVQTQFCCERGALHAIFGRLIPSTCHIRRVIGIITRGQPA